jgi:C-terminal peptidase prc
MNRANGRSAWKNLCARLTLAAFLAALLGPVVSAQVVDRAAPVATPAAGFALSGAISSAFSAPSIITPSALSAAPVFNAAPAAAPQAAAMPALPAASAAVQAAVLPASAASPAAAPTAGASLRSMSARSAALIAPGAVASDARSLSAAAFDGALAASPADEETFFHGPNGREYQLIPGSEDLVRGNNGLFYRLKQHRDGRISAQPVTQHAAQREIQKIEVPGLTDELMTKLVSALHIIDQSFVDKLSAEQWRGLIDKGLAAITAGLNEHHTEYYDKEGWAKNVQHEAGSMTGIGVIIDYNQEQEAFKKIFDEEKVKAGGVLDEKAEEKIAEKIPFDIRPEGILIKNVRKGSPAEKAGFKAGDRILSVDGQGMAGTPIKDVTTKIQGKAGTTVKFTVSRDGKIMVPDLIAVRAEMIMPLLTARMVAPGIGYIHYSEFRSDSEEEFIAALSGLRKNGAKKVIIDLRTNPGGNLVTATNILASLLPSGAGIYSTKHRGEIDSQARTKRDGPFAGMERIVLVDGNSASASELSAATLQDYGATVVGPSNSYGKFSFQNVLPLPPDRDPEQAESGLRITAGRFYSGKGRSFPGQYDPKTERNIPGSGGVTPDVIVPMTKDQERDAYVEREERLSGESPKPVADPVLDKAIEILRGRP